MSLVLGVSRFPESILLVSPYQRWGGIPSQAETLDRLYQDQPAMGGGAVKGACPNVD